MAVSHWKFWFIWALLLIFLIAGLWFFRAEAAESLWLTLRRPEIALFLNPDAEFAVKIGNYYFNVYGDGVYDLDRAEKYFKTALELDPMVPDAWHQLARIDFLRGNFYKALSKINKQIELHGDSFMASYYIRGLISGYSGDYGQAEADFKKFLAWDAENWAGHNDLAWIYFKKGDYKKVEEIARAGLRLNQYNPWLLTSLGVALLNLGEKDEARLTLRKALEEAQKLTPSDWQKAYPGNDPRVAKDSLGGMIAAIKSNLSLVDK